VRFIELQDTGGQLLGLLWLCGRLSPAKPCISYPTGHTPFIGLKTLHVQNTKRRQYYVNFTNCSIVLSVCLSVVCVVLFSQMAVLLRFPGVPRQNCEADHPHPSDAEFIFNIVVVVVVVGRVAQSA